MSSIARSTMIRAASGRASHRAADGSVLHAAGRISPSARLKAFALRVTGAARLEASRSMRPPSGGTAHADTTARLKPDATYVTGAAGLTAFALRQMTASRYNRYANANPIWATNIMRYMCAHETWFSSTARSSGRRSIRYKTYNP